MIVVKSSTIVITMNSVTREKHDASLQQADYHNEEFQNTLRRIPHRIRNTIFIGLGGTLLTGIALTVETAANNGAITLLQPVTAEYILIPTLIATTLYGGYAALRTATDILFHGGSAVHHRKEAVKHRAVGRLD